MRLRSGRIVKQRLAPQPVIKLTRLIEEQRFYAACLRIEELASPQSFSVLRAFGTSLCQ